MVRRPLRFDTKKDYGREGESYYFSAPGGKVIDNPIAKAVAKSRGESLPRARRTGVISFPQSGLFGVSNSRFYSKKARNPRDKYLDDFGPLYDTGKRVRKKKKKKSILSTTMKFLFKYII